LVTAYTGGTSTSASTTPDGIWSLRGIDYVTIDGIDIRENASNTTAASQMEYGYGLFKLSATDGAQFDTIKKSHTSNCRPSDPLVQPASTFLRLKKLCDVAAAGRLKNLCSVEGNFRNSLFFASSFRIL
jgi:hypothetical protein